MMNPENDPPTSGEPTRRPFTEAAKPKYKFTPEELLVLKECNKDSFYQRCIPLSATLAVSTFYGIQAGFLKANPRFGATPKVVAAVLLGYFIGKFSYQSKCAERLMQLPNSQLGEMLRQKRKGNLHESIDSGFGPAMSLAPFSGMNSTDTYSDLNPNSSLDIDTDRPENKGLDDHNRPSMDNQVIYEDEMPPEQKHITTYDELRKKNREEHQQRRIGNYREASQPPYSGAPPGGSYSGHQPGYDNMPSQPKNKYGDTWE